MRPVAATGRARVDLELEEHGGYFCTGCKRSWSSIVSLNRLRRAKEMRDTECEEESSSTELRNLFRTNLATGLEVRLPVFPAGIRDEVNM